MWLIYKRISWYHKFAKIGYVTANSPPVPSEVNIEPERFKVKLFGNYVDSLEL